jgi:oxalate decarboxylase
MLFLEMFASDHYADASLAQRIALTPHELVAAHLRVERSLLDNLPTEKRTVMFSQNSIQREG